MEESKGISVIIPTFNREKFLYPTLLCLLNQNIKSDFDYEIIIIDSGDEKKDSTKKMISFFQTQSTRLIYKKITNNRNRSLLRHKGAKLAQFNILLFLDNDMLTPPNFLEFFYNQFDKQEKQVLLGRRKSLIEFNINNIGEKALTENFEDLDLLPWYEDERMFETFNDNPWQYVFSHTLFLYKKDYFAIGGFNKQFGKQWGLEDIELGYKLAELGCDFKFVKECPDYHQPHFSQSSSEQPLAEINRYLMAKLHNSCDEEIMLCFFYHFSDYKQEVLSVRNNFIFKKPSKKFDLYLGCIHELGEKNFSPNEYLGLFLPFANQSRNNIYIYDSFFHFGEKIQVAIIAQAFRVGREIWFNKIDINLINQLKKLCFNINILFSYTTKNNYTILKKIGKSNKTAITILLPDITEIEKRFVFKWFALQLISSGIYVNLLEKRRIRNFDNEDFLFDAQKNNILSSRFDTSYGYIDYRTFDSMNMLREEKVTSTKNEESSLIIHDENFLLKYPGLEKIKFERCTHYDRNCFQFLTYACARSYISDEKRYENTEIHFDYCIFMNKGFLEDGIDIALNAIKREKEQGINKKTVIKTYDFEKQFLHSYPRHNQASKTLKLYRERKAFYDSIQKLKQCVYELNLEDNVSIVEENWEIERIIDLINQSRTLLYTSRETLVSPEVFFAILLNKNVILAKGHNIISPFDDYVSLVDSSFIPLSNAFKIPYSITNAPYMAIQMNNDSLFKKLNEETRDRISDELINQIDEFVKNLYKKLQNLNSEETPQ